MLVTFLGLVAILTRASRFFAPSSEENEGIPYVREVRSRALLFHGSLLYQIIRCTKFFRVVKLGRKNKKALIS